MTTDSRGESLIQFRQQCECGHPKAVHGPDNSPVVSATGRCHATVYEAVDNGPLTSGVNAKPCPCLLYQEATNA